MSFLFHGGNRRSEVNMTAILGQLNLKHRETYGCVVSTMVTDALVLKHQAKSIHNAN